MTGGGPGILSAHCHREDELVAAIGQRLATGAIFIQRKAATRRQARGKTLCHCSGTLDFEPALVYRHFRDSEKAAGIAAMVKLADSERGITVTADDLDLDHWHFNTPTGTLDLLESRGGGTLRTHAPADLITKLSPVRYDPRPSARCGVVSSTESCPATPT